MSSLRNAIHRRTHKERSQLSSRSHLGLLEKKKDYVVRAKDYKDKQKRLKAMKEKTLFRNKDEFYFGMINQKTKDGVHVGAVENRNKTFDADFLKLLKTQDQNYINYQRSVNQKKLERLENSIHFIEGDDDDADEGEDDELDYGMDMDMERDMKLDDFPENQEFDIKTSPSAKTKRTNHTIFLDTEKDVQEFDPAKHFDTPKELLSRKFNRPRLSALEAADMVLPDPKQLKKLCKKKEKIYKELASRKEREEVLNKMQLEMSLQKNLMGKGSKMKVGKDRNGLPIYKWKAIRQK